MFDRFKKLLGRKPPDAILGFACELKNPGLGILLFGSPREVSAGLAASAKGSFAELMNHIDTGFSVMQVSQDTPLHKWSGGPHALRLMELLDAVVADDREAADKYRDLLSTEVDGHPVALIAAANRGFTAMAKALVDAGASIHAEGDLGMTALHWACARGHASVADVLIEAGASIDARNWFFLTPPELAVMNGHGRLAQKLDGRSEDSASTNWIELTCSRLTAA